MTVSDTIRSIDGADSSQAAVRSAIDDVRRAVPTAMLIEPEKPDPSRVLRSLADISKAMNRYLEMRRRSCSNICSLKVTNRL